MDYLLIDRQLLGEPIEIERLEPLLALDIVAYRREPTGHYAVAAEHREELCAMLRLAYDLDINPAGVETIMHMRRRMRELQAEVQRLRQGYRPLAR